MTSRKYAKSVAYGEISVKKVRLGDGGLIAATELA
jgi:hypothetical protein